MRKFIIIIFCVLGMIVGIAIGESLAGVPALSWLSLGGELGFKTPLTVDLNFLQFTLGIWCKVNIAGVIGMVLFALLSRFVVRWVKL